MDKQKRGSSILIVQQASNWRVEYFDGHQVVTEVCASVADAFELVGKLTAWDELFAGVRLV